MNANVSADTLAVVNVGAAACEGKRGNKHGMSLEIKRIRVQRRLIEWSYDQAFPVADWQF